MQPGYNRGIGAPTAMENDRRLITALFLLLLVSIGGATYFHFRLGHDWIEAVYYVAITLSTVGYAAPAGLDHEGMLAVVFMIAMGVGTAAYAISLMVSHVVEGGLADVLEKRRMMRQIQALEGHVIVCGIGRIGRLIARELKEHGKDVLCIDKDDALLEEMRREGFPTLAGDATEEQVLLAAGIDRAEILVSAMPSDAESVFLTLTARFLNRRIRIVARGSDEATERKLKRAGANVVILPTLIGGRRMVQAVLLPNVMDFVDLTTGRGSHALRLDEVTIPPGSKLVGKTLGKSNLRSTYGLIIVAIRKPDGVMRFNPSSETKLEASDILVALGEGKSLDRLKAELR